MKMILCESSGKLSVVDPKDGDEIRKLIGGWMEIVRSWILPHDYIIVVDEEGLYKDYKRNFIGSLLYSPNGGYPLVGDVLIGKEGFVDGEPDIIDLSDEEIDQFVNHTIPYIVRISHV